jgi:hypothetical protein
VINVCYVANYSDVSRGPGGDPQTAITNAEKNNNPIAVVAMVGINNEIPISTNPFHWVDLPYVYFIVFTPPPSNAPSIDDFVPNTQAVLDGEGPKAVPGVCIACHGGTYSSHNVSGARFLPFDTPSFLYDQVNAHFSADSQSEPFRFLNIIARNVDTAGQAPGGPFDITSQTIRDLIDGWYSWCGGVDAEPIALPPSFRLEPCNIDDVGHPFIPSAPCVNDEAPPTCGWSPNGLNALFYQQVPRVLCRTCHIAHSDVFNWQNYYQTISPSRIKLLCSVVNSYFMPFAQVPYNRFWGAPLDQSSLQTSIDLFGANCQFTPPPQ